MRLAILSDIHANAVALETVLAEIDRRGADALVCLGDIVGYGPDPGPCVEMVRERCAISVMGNHDEAVALRPANPFLPKDGVAAAEMHREQLSADQLSWLANLPLRHEGPGCTFVHAAPSAPAAWLRLDAFATVQAQFGAFETAVCFVGHSHRPAVVSDSVGVARVRPGHRYLVNVGSVGQPRDHDARAAFGLFDTTAISYELVRVHYDVALTRSRIVALGLPPSLGDRLSRGV